MDRKLIERIDYLEEWFAVASMRVRKSLADAKQLAKAQGNNAFDAHEHIEAAEQELKRLTEQFTKMMEGFLDG